MTIPDNLSTISAFARRVDLTPSALRFYDDCGLLTPKFVDPASGYRYYADDQEDRAVMLRELREAEMSLADVRAVLESSPQDAARIVQAHVQALEGRIGPARRVAARVLASVPRAQRHCQVVLSGEDLASAARQVVPAASSSNDFPALTCVLLEFGPDETTMVASDRYRLSVRAMRSYGFSGLPRRVLIPAAELTELARWAAGERRVEFTVDGESAILTRGKEQQTTSLLDLEFPDYRSLLDGVGPSITRAIVDRTGLLDGIVERGPDTVRLTIGDDRLLVSGSEPMSDLSLAAVCRGPSMRVGFSPKVLGATLAASVGPDVLLEFVDPNRPVIVRSADQGTFTTLAMPVRLEAADR